MSCDVPAVVITDGPIVSPLQISRLLVKIWRRRVPSSWNILRGHSDRTLTGKPEIQSFCDLRENRDGLIRDDEYSTTQICSN
jgi:hypothetical protein